MSTLLRASALITACLLSAPAYSLEVSVEVRRCSAVTNGVKRLECFDAIAQTLQKDADNKAKENLLSGEVKNPKSQWAVDISQSKIDDSTTVVLWVKSLDSVRGRFGKVVNPTLVLRCLSNETSAHISFDSLHMTDIQNYGSVTFRIDKNKAFTKTMRASTDSHALGLWSGSSAIPFIKNLFNGSTLLVQAMPFSSSAITFSFDISGLKEAIEPLRKACKW